MFSFKETEPGQWHCAFVFRDQTLAGGEGFASEVIARKAVDAFASGVGMALIDLLGHQ
ncbi:hypothetical protein HCU64_20815 [Methylobacterium sp. C25]|uniref:hypothetical protein n=1 Tax=Methylobacterium sp. C25 TaxID=2721622 RepID=UPI001F459160|nr:hypothetical protein [Methylobacterium sp. C25]MCE4226196.1 hypothetical protein [Methylobacterium sp. C25]